MKVFQAFKNVLGGSKPKESLKKVTLTFIRHNREVQVDAKPGDNLMDVANSLVNEGVNVFGLCDKQLACTTCSVHILNKYEKIKTPSEEEMDILFLLPEYNYKQTRMSCQVTINEDMDGMIIKIPETIAEWKLEELNK